MTQSLEHRIRMSVRDVADFPQPGILFKDITPILADPGLLASIIDAFRERFAEDDVHRIAAVESRGFIFGAPLALALGCGFAPIRKVGKLPHATLRVDYALEYGAGALEAHIDAIAPGERVLIVDDVLATGGTAAAAVDIVRQLGGEPIALACVIELGFLDGRRRLPEDFAFPLVRFDS